jgi:hypothetical protein
MTKLIYPAVIVLLFACNDAAEDERGDGTTNQGTPPTENVTNPGNASNMDSDTAASGSLGDTIGTPAPEQEMPRL